MGASSLCDRCRSNQRGRDAAVLGLCMNRRSFVRLACATATAATPFTCGTAAVAAALAGNTGSYRIASAVLPRHERVEEVFPVLEHYKARGFTGVWIENDYLRWSWKIHPDQAFTATGCCSISSISRGVRSASYTRTTCFPRAANAQSWASRFSVRSGCRSSIRKPATPCGSTTRAPRAVACGRQARKDVVHLQRRCRPGRACGHGAWIPAAFPGDPGV